MKIPYTKTALTFKDQISRLKSRGLTIEDEPNALHYLTHINYYRLSAYMYPFLEDKEHHIFKKGVTFQNILNVYNFDRELRLLILDAIERIEISLRTNIIYVLSHKHGPFWVSNNGLYFNQNYFQEHIKRLKEEIGRSDEKFIEHYFSKYSEEIPPAWISMEIASFGLLSLLFKNLKSFKDMKEIAQRYGLNRIVFESWFHSLVYIRNVCAHHSRLWNRELGIRPNIPKSIGGIWLNKSDELRNDRVFIIIAIIIYFLEIINTSSSFKLGLHKLFEKYSMIDLAPMGFPKDWKDEELFKI